MDKFVIVPQKSQWSTDGAVKPRKDVGFFLNAVGYKSVELRMFHGESVGSNAYNALLGEVLVNGSKGSVVINQLPSYCGDDFDKAVGTTLRDKEFVPVALVHDIDNLRFGGDVSSFIDVLDAYDIIVVASQKIADYLHDNGLTVPEVITRGPWDYYSEDIKPTINDEGKYIINYAGNLTGAKAGFLEHFSDKFKMLANVWGAANPADDSINVLGFNYMHKKDPEKLDIDKGWGLIWDNNRSNDSLYHSYQEYNWPAKLSLYLRNGLPVIVDSHANIASFVQEHNVGFCVDSLDKIKPTIDNLSQDDYDKMIVNANRLSEMIGEGHYDYQMADTIDSIINSNSPFSN